MSMMARMAVRQRGATVVAVAMLLAGSAAWAGTPTVVWQAAGGYPGPFSADGSVMYMGTSANFQSTGFQVRRASDGALLKTITLPAASQSYDKSAFSPDKQFVAISLVDSNGVTKIELWSLSTGSLVRTITTDAVRNIRGLDISANSGLVASMERFAYGGGGMLRVFRTSDGTLVLKRGPYLTNSTAFTQFSTNGGYLAFFQDVAYPFGFNILRTSDWSQVQQITPGNSYMIKWSGPDTAASVWLRGNNSLQIPYRQVNVPGGLLVRQVSFDDSFRYVTAVTSDNKYLLTYQFQTSDPTSPPANTLFFLRTSDSGAQVTYTFNSTIVSSGTINPAGTLFSYGICSSTGACTTYVAQMPALP
jgi:hypothetical protein